MQRVTRQWLTLLAALVMIGASFAGAAGVAAQDSGKPTVTVGAISYTEQSIVGEMAALLLEDHGYDVERQLNLGGTAVAQAALQSGDIDIYIGYTGTALVAVLGLEVPDTGNVAASPAAGATPVAVAGMDRVYDIVKREFDQQFNLRWLKPWGFNNTYALAVTAETANELGLETISDLQGHAGDMTFGGTQEFLVREDGLPGVEAAYDIHFGDTVGLDPGLTYSALDEGDVDIISAFSTDGRIPALDLVILDDNKHFFPPYYAAPIVREELLEQSPEIADILNQLAGQIGNSQMQDMNYQVDDGGMTPREVARQFLQDQGLSGTGS